MSYFNEIYNDPELSARAKQVLVYLHDRANKDGESWYAIGTMAKDLSLSRSTIKRALAELIRQGRVVMEVGVGDSPVLLVRPVYGKVHHHATADKLLQ